MIMIFLTYVGLIAIGSAMIWFAINGYGGLNYIAGTLGMIILITTSIFGGVFVVKGWHWVAAEQKVQIINREYGTNYTQKEVFFASDVIDTIHEIDRKRMEVNGDLACDSLPE